MLPDQCVSVGKAKSLPSWPSFPRQLTPNTPERPWPGGVYAPSLRRDQQTRRKKPLPASPGHARSHAGPRTRTGARHLPLGTQRTSSCRAPPFSPSGPEPTRWWVGNSPQWGRDLRAALGLAPPGRCLVKHEPPRGCSLMGRMPGPDAVGPRAATTGHLASVGRRAAGLANGPGAAWDPPLPPWDKGLTLLQERFGPCPAPGK